MLSLLLENYDFYTENQQRFHFVADAGVDPLR